MRDNHLIHPKHEVSQYIRGFKIHANTLWECVDYVCIPINIPEACHWVLAVINIRCRCIHVPDSLFYVRSKHFAAANDVARKLAIIISLFFISIDFYGIKNDTDWRFKVSFLFWLYCGSFV